MSERHHSKERPYFMWDYALDEEDIRNILQQGTPQEKAWIIGRILEYAKWQDIWRYLTVVDIRNNFRSLKFRRPQDHNLWAYALERWGLYE